MGSRADVFDQMQTPLDSDQAEELKIPETDEDRAERAWRSAMGSAEGAIVCQDWPLAMKLVSEAARIADTGLALEGANVATWRRRSSASMSLFTLALRKLQQNRLHAEGEDRGRKRRLH